MEFLVRDKSISNIFKYIPIIIGLIVCVYLIGTELTTNHNVFKVTVITVVTLLTYALAVMIGFENTDTLYYILMIYVAQACVHVGYDVVFGKPSHDEKANTKKTHREVTRELLGHISYASVLLFVTFVVTFVIYPWNEKLQLISESDRNILQYPAAYIQFMLKESLRNNMIFLLQCVVIGTYIMVGIFQLIVHASGRGVKYTEHDINRKNQLFILLSNFGSVPLVDLVTYLFLFNVGGYLIYAFINGVS